MGGEFLVDLRVGYPIADAMQSDEVADTLNYAELYQLVKREMEIPSKLLEHVAGRIVKAIVVNTFKDNQEESPHGCRLRWGRGGIKN